MVLRLMYEPQELVDTGNLSNEEWLSYRRRGIGGSDAAAILGISPWRTARDLYYDKLSVVKADMDENWVALEMGHLLENLVARIFAKKTGLRIFQRKVMFQHPLYPWMLADLDYLAELPDGSNAILEIKTTNYNARENWWYNGEEIVPVYYDSQGRHYMSVMNLDRVYFCCLYGNNEDEVIIRHLDRDYAYESELIALEDAFWNEHVQKHQPPDYTESGDLILQSLQRWRGIDRRDLPPAAFGAPQVTQIHQYLQLQEEKNALSKQVTQLDTQMQQLKGLLVSELDGKDCATCADGEQNYVISYNPIRRQGISKDNLVRLREVYPEIYKVLADFGDAVLAGQLGKKGARFVTWEWDFDRKGVHAGHYFMENYEAAKLDFAARAGLINEQRLFSDEQLAVIRNACAFALEDDATLSYAEEKQLQSVQEQIELLLPQQEQEQHHTMEQTM